MIQLTLKSQYKVIQTVLVIIQSHKSGLSIETVCWQVTAV